MNHPVKKETKLETYIKGVRKDFALHPEKYPKVDESMFESKPVKKEQCECCGSTPYTEKMGYHCPHCPLVTKENKLTSPRPDGWEERFKKQFDNQGPWGYPFSQTGLYQGIVFFIKQLLLSTRQEDAKAFRGMVRKQVQGEFTEINGEDFVSISTPTQKAVNQALSNIEHALSTWEEKK